MTTLTLPDSDTFADDDVEGSSGLLLEVMGGIRASLGRLTEQQDKQERERHAILQAIRPLTIPAGQFTGAGVSTTCLIASAELFGPRSGVCWDVRRITVTGLGSSETVTLYKVVTPTAASAVPNNAIATFTGTNPAPYGPGVGACWLTGGENLMVYGTGLANTDVITVTWSGVEVDAPWAGAYLL